MLGGIPQSWNGASPVRAAGTNGVGLQGSIYMRQLLPLEMSNGTAQPTLPLSHAEAAAPVPAGGLTVLRVGNFALAVASS
jgi:hypothetical protein